MGRSVENSADALMPLTDHADVRDALGVISECGRIIAVKANTIYQKIAREAARGQ